MIGKVLRTRRKGQAGPDEWEIGPGLNIIGEDLHYVWPNDVPFMVLHAEIISSVHIGLPIP